MGEETIALFLPQTKKPKQQPSEEMIDTLRKIVDGSKEPAENWNLYPKEE